MSSARSRLPVLVAGVAILGALAVLFVFRDPPMAPQDPADHISDRIDGPVAQAEAPRRGSGRSVASDASIPREAVGRRASSSADARFAPKGAATGWADGPAIRGRVTDGRGRAIAGVEVRARRRTVRDLQATFGPVAAVTATARDGRFILSPPGGSDYTVAVHAKGRAPLVRHGVAVPSKSAVDMGDLEVTRGATVIGVVRSLDAGLLPQALVRIERAAGVPRDWPEEPADYARSGDDGRFELRDVAAGVGRVRVQAAEHAPTLRDVQLRAGDTTSLGEIVLERGRTIEGDVVDERWAVLSGATVIAVGERQTARAKSGPTGRFVLRHLSPGAYRLVASMTGYLPPDASGASVVAAGTKGTRLRLERAASLRGQVLDAQTRRPVTRFTIAFGSPEQADMLAELRTFDTSDGRFSLDGLTAAPLCWEVRADEYRPVRPPDVFPRPGESIGGQVVLLRPGGAVTGRIVAGDRPVAGATVLARLPRKGDDVTVIGGDDAFREASAQRVVKTTADGTFTIRNLAGPHALEVRHPSFAPLRTDSIRFPEEGRQDVGTFEMNVGGTIQGFVAGTDGTPVRGAEVWVKNRSAGYQRRCLTNHEGRFRLERVPVGVFEATLTKRPGPFDVKQLLALARSGTKRIRVVVGENAIVEWR